MPRGKEGYEIRHRHHRRDYEETQNRNKYNGAGRRVWEIAQGYNNIITRENNAGQKPFCSRTNKAEVKPPLHYRNTNVSA